MNVRTSKKIMWALAVICMLNFTSCSKFEDGPFLSLKTKNKRLIGEWEVVEIDGDKPAKALQKEILGSSGDDEIDVEINDIEIILEFEKGGDFIMEQKMDATITFNYYGSYEYDFDMEQKIEGDWEWSNSKESVEVDIDVVSVEINGQDVNPDDIDFDLDNDDFEILRLTNNELWFEDDEGYEFHCEKN